MATSLTSALVGRDEVIIESSIWVAVITGRASRPAPSITCFCTTGTSSIGSSIPRSPRATIRQSAARTISSIASTACGFSIFAISGIRVCSRTWLMSSARRTKDSATRSTPIDSPKRRPSRSSSGRVGRSVSSPGTFRPWREATVPPTSTAASISPSSGRTAVARRRIDPSARYMTSPGSTRLGQPGPRDRHAVCVARLVAVGAARQGQLLARPELREVALERADPQLGPGEVLEHRHLAALGLRGGADPLGRLRVLLVRPVGEVQARDVHPGAH